MSAAHPAHFEFIDFIAGGTTPEQIIAFRSSNAAQQRVEELIEREKENGLSPDEKAELEYFFSLNIFSVSQDARRRDRSAWLVMCRKGYGGKSFFAPNLVVNTAFIPKLHRDLLTRSIIFTARLL